MKHGQQRLRAGAAQSLSDRVTTWLFLLPALAVVVVAVVIPLGNSFILSFQRVRINVPDFEPVFLGLENYRVCSATRCSSVVCRTRCCSPL